MRTGTRVLLSDIAIKAQKLKPAILRKALLTQPSVEVRTTATNIAAMLSTIVVHMVNCKNFTSVLTTASTNTPISSNDLLAKPGIPELVIGLLATLTAYMLHPVAISTQKLKAILWKALLAQPLIETPTVASGHTLQSAVIIDMIDSQESRMSLAAHDTDATIYGNYFITKFIHTALTSIFARTSFPTQLILLQAALLAQAALMRSDSKTLDTTSLLSSTDIRRSTHGSLARLAVELQTIMRLFHLREILSGSRKVIGATMAVLHNGILRYNVHAGETNPFIRHAPGCDQHRWGSMIITSTLYHNPPLQASLSHFHPLLKGV